MRSLLYVPADRPDMLAKARQRGADAIIVDLEDAVAMANKQAARANVRAFVDDPSPGSGAIIVRVTNTDETLREDVAAALSPNVAAITLAKAATVTPLNRIDDMASAYEMNHGLPARSIGVICLIETAEGVRNAYELASHGRTVRLGLGEADLGADLGIPHDAPDDVWAPIRSRIVVDSAAAKVLPPIAPVSTNFSDAGVLEESTRQLALRGFGARPAIHPAQIDAINAAFTPTADALDAARDVVERYEAAVNGGSAVVLDREGHMVDEAVIRQARHVLSLASGGES